mmetsp:Transcript_10625/g.31398  ORF Transcript_10625/g.31398 Transcript_10625/m.31398 type:complete len:305 (-) Transcript_10625:319-1233(-)
MPQGGSLTMPQVGSFKSVSAVVTGNRGGGGRRRGRSKKKPIRRVSVSPASSGDELSRSTLQPAETRVIKNERRMPKLNRSSFFTVESKKTKQRGGKTSEFRRSRRSGKGIDLGEVETDDSSFALNAGAQEVDPVEPTLRGGLRPLATCNGSDSREVACLPPDETRDDDLDEKAYQNAASCKSVSPVKDARRTIEKPDVTVAAQSCANLVSPNAMKFGALAGNLVKSLSASAVSGSKDLAMITAEVGDMIVNDLATQTEYLVEELVNFFDPADETEDKKRAAREGYESLQRAEITFDEGSVISIN